METELSPIKNKAQVLWLGPDWQTEISDDSYDLSRASLEEALGLISKQRYTVTFLEIKNQNDIEIIEKIIWFAPALPIILIIPSYVEENVRLAINRLRVFRFLQWPSNDKKIQMLIQDAIKETSRDLEREILLKEYSSQNKKLELMTHDLEQNVEERTQHLQASAAEESEKLSRERQLIRFINELAVQESFTDILQCVRKEIRRFHKVQNLTFAWHQEKGRTRFFEFRGNRFVFSEIESNVQLEMNSANSDYENSVRQLFANQFGRPLSKALLFPMSLKLVRQTYGFDAEAIFCFEYSLMSGNEIQEFTEFVQDRLQPLAIVLDRILLEQRLELSSSRWEKTFDGIRDPLAILDSDGKIIRSNSKFTKELLAPTTQGEITVGRKTYRVFSYPIRFDHQGQYTNLIHHYVDITESREIYLRMLQSEKMGAIGQLAGHIAHELNNPLTGIRSLAQVLMKEFSPEQQTYQDLQHIESSAARSQLIIKYLLDFSRGETHSTELISIDEIVERTLPMVKTILRQHRYSLDLHSRDFQVQVEPNLIQQVVFNLVNNACQAMKEPGQITLSTRVMGVKGGQVELKIMDTGPGIPLEIQSRIFEPFFTTKKEGHGTGLGLSTSKAIIQKFGGQLSFESDGQLGTSFIIRLPIVMEKK